MTAELALIAARFEQALAGHDPGKRLPLLERLLARGRHRPATTPRPGLARWQAMVLESVEPALPCDAYASAPVSWLGHGAEPLDGFCLHASPVHIAALADSLQIVSPGPVSAEEAMHLSSHLAAQFGSAAQAFVPLTPCDWYLRSRGALAALAPSLDDALGADMRDALPVGKDGATLRRLLTEAQMLLHEHPVNERRAEEGRRPINGVWFWGGGVSPAPELQLDSILIGDDPFVRGLVRLAGGQVRTPDPAGVATQAAGPRPVVLVVDPVTLADLERIWLSPIVEALRRGRLRRVQLGLGSRWVDISSPGLRRFWKRDRAVAEALG